MTQLPSFLSDVSEQASLKYLCFRGFLLRRERASSILNHFLCRLTAIVVCVCVYVCACVYVCVGVWVCCRKCYTYLINNTKIHKGMCILIMISFINTQKKKLAIQYIKALSGKRNHTFPLRYASELALFMDVERWAQCETATCHHCCLRSTIHIN